MAERLYNNNPRPDYTPDYITDLKPDEVFVFGSNLAGQLFVAVSETDETMNDFAHALVDLGVENAIYLVGSHSYFGWYIDYAGEKTLFAPDVHRGTYKNENYIIWCNLSGK